MKSTMVIGMLVCFMMMATIAWSVDLPGVPNGTVTDGNLVWLKNADCFGGQNWDRAKSSAASLKSGDCGLTDGSKAGQWRLPTKEELVNRQKNLLGFYNVQANGYWSSSSYASYTNLAWFVRMNDGGVFYINKSRSTFLYVWPVRAGQ